MKTGELPVLAEDYRHKLLQRVKDRVEAGYYQREKARQATVVALLEHIRWFEKQTDKKTIISADALLLVERFDILE